MQFLTGHLAAPMPTVTQDSRPGSSGRSPSGRSPLRRPKYVYMTDRNCIWKSLGLARRRSNFAPRYVLSLLNTHSGFTHGPNLLKLHPGRWSYIITRNGGAEQFSEDVVLRLSGDSPRLPEGVMENRRLPVITADVTSCVKVRVSKFNAWRQT